MNSKTLVKTLGKVLILMTFLSLLTQTTLAGDAEELFKTKCGKCHQLNAGGTMIGKGHSGPELTGYAKKRPVDFLKAYILDPVSARETFAAIYEKEIKGKYNAKMKKPSEPLTATELQVILTLLSGD